ncbi:MAG: type I polyketide synthase, partial [Deltaproteobacteria bacterium]|nr:type I polyketide synthase [Deltaproteobacteria bacterium]
DTPADRWAVAPDRAMHTRRPAPDRVYSTRACLVDDPGLVNGSLIDGLDIDAGFAAKLDVMVQLSLRAGRDAWFDAHMDRVDRSRTGVILGNIALPTESTSLMADWVLGRRFDRGLFATRDSAPAAINRFVTGLPAGILAKALGLGGGHYTLDAACASSLFALDLAAAELRSGRADAMLTGGLSRPDCLYTQMGFAQLTALSPSGRCSPFDQKGDGLVVGEGAGVFVLKRLTDALAHGDTVHAVLRGTGTSNDVDGNLLAPSREGQLRAMHSAYREADWDPRSVELIECHATGTPVGDGVEFASLKRLWGDDGFDAGQCTIGSVKSNVGHLLTGAGAAGLAKVLLAMRHRVLPATANFDTPGDTIALDGSPFVVRGESTEWKTDGPLRAAVSGFGFGGTNAHVLLEEWTPETKTSAAVPAALTGPQSQQNHRGDRRDDVVIVGMSATVSTWDGLDAFRERVLGGGLAVAAAPKTGYWGLDDPPSGYFIDELEIPIGEFRIPPKELEETLPQQLLMLQVTKRALADAETSAIDRLRTGVFIGISLDLNTTNYHLRWVLDERATAAHRGDANGPASIDAGFDEWLATQSDRLAAPLNANRVMGNLGGIVASRVAREFALGGPSYVLSSEEGSGYSALEAAVRGLGRGQVDCAVVGAVDLAGDPRQASATDALKPMSRTGHVRPFDRAADGTLPGEGAVALVLKRRRDAERDGDRIYAAVLGLASTTGGTSDAVVPTAEAYRRALVRAYDDADIEPSTVAFVEAHGSGHPAEDRVEAEALGAWFNGDRERVIGSAKADVGHTGAAAALISVAKAALALHHRTLPPMRGIRQGRRALDHLTLPRDPAHWPDEPGGAPRRAAVSSMSSTGHVGHVVLEAVHGVGTGEAARAADKERAGAQGRASASIIVPVGRGPLGPMEPYDPRASRRPKGSHGSSTFETSETSETPTHRTAAAPIVALSESPAPQHRSTAINQSRPKSADRHFTPQPVSPGGTAARMLASSEATAAAHGAYLSLSNQVTALVTEHLERNPQMLHAVNAVSQGASAPILAPGPAPALREAPREVALDRAMCLEFATGSIGAVLGPEFAPVDAHPTRVRLPDEPLMLVDRILRIEGEPRSMSHGKVVTEHDVREGAWYLDNGRIPTCVAVEAGQADLFLSAYLGIDFITKGLAVYRLLDAVVTFHGELPGVGDVIHYDIDIREFFRHGDTWLFRFEFEATVNGQKLMTMRDGCAGFFSQGELDAGKGIVHSRLEQQWQRQSLPKGFGPLAPMTKCAVTAREVEALIAGDLQGAFGADFASLPVRAPLTIPGGRMQLVHRVDEIDPEGGRYGLGFIRAQADIRPDDWFLTCHFVDDKVMPGTLMYECCLHTLRIYLLRMGWVVEKAGVVAQPIEQIGSRLKCRGQVLDTTALVTYEVSIKELGYGPEPFAVVDALMFADGKPIVEISDMSLRLTGASRADVEGLWDGSPRDAAGPATPVALYPAVYDYDRILAFSSGNPSDAFGEPYRVFDEGRKIARLPRPPFQFLDRIVDVTGEPFVMEAGATCVAQVEVTPDQWYFRSNRQGEIPFAVLLEMALQPCGWLAGYVGSALTAPEDVKFRNLGGDAVQHRPVLCEQDVLTTHVEMTGVSSSGGMIIQHFSFDLRSERYGSVYTGTTYFGFFSSSALADQVGIRDAKHYEVSSGERARAKAFPVPIAAPFPDDTMRMVSEVDLYVADGGPHGLGYVEGSIAVSPDFWFFEAHFFEDPVWPGSLGLEAFLQLMKVAANERWQLSPEAQFQTMPLGARHEWVYRGQVIPTDGRVTVKVVIKSVDDDNHRLVADGFLCVDGRTIYQMIDFALETNP